MISSLTRWHLLWWLRKCSCYGIYIPSLSLSSSHISPSSSCSSTFPLLLASVSMSLRFLHQVYPWVMHLGTPVSVLRFRNHFIQPSHVVHSAWMDLLHLYGQDHHSELALYPVQTGACLMIYSSSSSQNLPSGSNDTYWMSSGFQIENCSLIQLSFTSSPSQPSVCPY